MNFSETTARARDINPRRKESYQARIVVAAIAFVVAPFSLISFMVGWLLFAKGRQQPSVIGQIAVILSIPFVVTGTIVSSVTGYVDNVSILLSGIDARAVAEVVFSQAPFAIPAGLFAAWVFCLVKKASMPEDDLKTFFKRTPLQMLKRKRNIKAVQEGKNQPIDGIDLGVDDEGNKFDIKYDDLGMHAFVVGASGSGKSTTLVAMARKIIADNRSLILVDLKGDKEMSDTIASISQEFGKKFHHFVAEDPNLPYSGPSEFGRANYNPMTRGDYDHLSDLLISMVQKGSGDSEIYRTISHEYLKTMFHVMSLTGGQNPDTLSQIIDMLNPESLRRVASRLPNTEESARLRSDVSNLCDRKKDRTFSAALYGISSTVSKLRKSIEGNYLQSPTEGQDYIDLLDISNKGEVALFSLDSSAKGETAQFIAQYIIEDLKLLTSQLNSNPSPQPVHVILDEFSAVTGDNLIGLINKARAAGISITLATQTTDDLSETSDTFVKRVLSNTDVLICMRVNRFEEAEILTQSFGEEMQRIKTTNYRSERHIISTSEASRSGEESVREEMGFKVSPSELMGMNAGEAWVKIAHRDKIAHIQIIPRGAHVAHADWFTKKVSAPPTEEVSTEAFSGFGEPTEEEIARSLEEFSRKKSESKAGHRPQQYDDTIPDGWVIAPPSRPATSTTPTAPRVKKPSMGDRPKEASESGDSGPALPKRPTLPIRPATTLPAHPSTKPVQKPVKQRPPVKEVVMEDIDDDDISDWKLDPRW